MAFVALTSCILAFCFKSRTYCYYSIKFSLKWSLTFDTQLIFKVKLNPKLNKQS